MNFLRKALTQPLLLLACASCGHENCRDTKFNDVARAIKFSIPPDSIGNEPLLQRRQGRIDSLVREQCAGISELRRVHTKTLGDNTRYYEYAGKSSGKYIVTLVFERPENTIVRTVESGIPMAAQTRYELHKGACLLYKKTAAETAAVTFSIWYRMADGSASLACDDGYSKW